MSGRGQVKGRGNRNGGRSNRTRKNQHGRRSNRNKKSLSDYTYYLGNSRQASDFENTTEFIIIYIKKMYSQGKDIAKALHDLEPINTLNWRPTLEVSMIAGNDAEAEDKQKQENSK